MYWRSAAALLLSTVALFEGTSATLITVTKHVGSCKATYSSKTRSTTVVKSTVTVQPVPWTDQDANSGSPFVLELGIGGPGKGEKASYNSADVCDAQWSDNNGWLEGCSVRDKEREVDDNQRRLDIHASWCFKTSRLRSHRVLQPINLNFHFQNGALRWSNSNFSGGAAQLYKAPIPNSNSKRVIVRFSGPIDPSWSALMVSARPANEVAIQPLPAQTSSTKRSTTTTKRSTTSTRLSSTSTRRSTTSTRHNTTSTRRSTSSTRPASSTQKSSSARPSPSENVTPNGLCGPSNGYNCAGSVFGDCCSQYGYCGSGVDYCGIGCQPVYGICSVPPSSSGLSARSTSLTATSSHSSALMSTSLSSGSSHPTSTYTSIAEPIGPGPSRWNLHI